MKINQIMLHNFGSYRGNNSFNFDSDDPLKRVSIIGGKNGAGKTTLFTAIQVCLYGNYAFGYKTAGKRYLSEIYSLINDQIRIDEAEQSFLEIHFQQADNTDLINYTIRRTWTWPRNELRETVDVLKDGVTLDADELVSFQNYLIHLIPPDLLKLYFFDGEKIADYFLSSKDVNIRETLMVLSGNDTFDLLYDQVKRIFRSSDVAQSPISRKYLDLQLEASMCAHRISELEEENIAAQENIDALVAEIAHQKIEYKNHGGITVEDWTNLNNELRAEEERRERLNYQRKTYATDVLPFLMVPQLIAQVLPQLHAEKEHQTYDALKASLDSPRFMKMLDSAVHTLGTNISEADTSKLFSHIRDYLLDSKWENFETLFSLSGDEEGQVQSSITQVNSFEKSTFQKYQKRIEASIEKSKNLRASIQNSNIEHFEEYMTSLSRLEESLKIEQLKKDHAQELLDIKRSEQEANSVHLRGLKKEFEEQLKAQSVSALSGKVLLLLEDLQDKLYSSLIKQVEADLNDKFKELIRKKDFFSRIEIDSNFTVHIFRDEPISHHDLLSLLKGGNVSSIKDALGAAALLQIQNRFECASAAELRNRIEVDSSEFYTLSVELNKDRLSSGEKQIFVMSLYWAMMKQSNNELPYIIDTPFARIDAQHRANITEYFFMRLPGQLIILSTDEELSSHHLTTMQDQISKIYMLEYGDDKATTIHANQYFEV